MNAGEIHQLGTYAYLSLEFVLTFSLRHRNIDGDLRRAFADRSDRDNTHAAFLAFLNDDCLVRSVHRYVMCFNGMPQRKQGMHTLFCERDSVLGNGCVRIAVSSSVHQF